MLGAGIALSAGGVMRPVRPAVEGHAEEFQYLVPILVGRIPGARRRASAAASVQGSASPRSSSAVTPRRTLVSKLWPR